MRTLTEKEMCHERLGEKFAEALSQYDTRRRVETLIDLFLTDDMVQGKQALDVGCGLGFFSQRLHQRGARVMACDIGPTLVEQTRNRVGCDGQVADALALVDQFGKDRFDLVVSSECIEHVPNPADAIRQMAGVLKPGGYLAISTPNKLWYPVVRAATILRLRPFDGHENFSTFGVLRRAMESGGVRVQRLYGLHLFPFQFHLDRLSTFCDRNFQFARSLMINLCLLGRKEG